ncbi:MAG: AAA family ATPase [Bacteroidetes bacterium]|nr:AAA family ATPase [Bacteroidota bacterium]
MSGSIKSFLNHGILPFVGRVAEAERLYQFWVSTATSNQLRVALVVGEAGIGKSRLIEELIPRITRAGGAVVHTKLYPESTASIVPIITRALRTFNARRIASAADAPGTLMGVIAELRKLTHLRPTVLVIEDIHLMQDDALSEFQRLLEALTDEMLGIICVARPMELPIHALLRRRAVEEIHLAGLSFGHITTLLERLFGLRDVPEIVNLLAGTTYGNPLALRSAIRGALRSGTLALDQASNTWRVAYPLPVLTQSLRQNVNLLSEGMVSHLLDDERQNAALLACLGEIFSREAAREMIPEADLQLEALMAKGILVSARSPATLMPGNTSAYPALAFTHTILHTYLKQRTGCDAATLIRIIGSNAPIYSILPFQVLAANDRPFVVPKDVAGRAVMRAIEVATALDGSPDWRLGIEAWDAAKTIRNGCRDIWSPTEARRFEAELLICRLALQRRMEQPEEFASLVHQLVVVTDDPIPEELRPYRLRAFAALHALGRRTDSAICTATWERAQNFVGQHPEMRSSPTYVQYLEAAARSMIYMGNDETLREIERQLIALEAGEAAQPEYRNQIRQIIAFHFLELFETEEELARRLQILKEVEPHVDTQHRISFLISKIVFMYLIGRMDEAIRTADSAVPMFRELGLPTNIYFGSLTRLCAVASLVGGIEHLEQAVDALCNDAPNDIPDFETLAHLALIETAVSLNAFDWLTQRQHLHKTYVPRLRPETQVLYRLYVGIPLSGHSSVPRASRTFKPVAAIISAGTPSSVDAVRQALLNVLRVPVLRLQDIHEKRSAIEVIPYFTVLCNDTGLADSLSADVTDAVHRLLEWLLVRRLPLFMSAIVDRYGRYLETRELQRWRARIVDVARDRNTEALGFEQAERERPHISMLGHVTFLPLRGQPIPIRGLRLRTLLGLMVANMMRHEPLAQQEFNALAAGTDDPDKARKTLNGIVFRLREIIGHNAIITEDDTPALNLALLDVDLVEADHALNEATTALREGSLSRAQRWLQQALDLTHGKVPFPALYDDLFERSRQEFEARMRTLLLKVGRALLDERDPEKAEKLLSLGFNAMAGDEELAELLCEAFEATGRHIEAERVRIRISELND